MAPEVMLAAAATAAAAATLALGPGLLRSGLDVCQGPGSRVPPATDRGAGRRTSLWFGDGLALDDKGVILESWIYRKEAGAGGRVGRGRNEKISKHKGAPKRRMCT